MMMMEEAETNTIENTTVITLDSDPQPGQEDTIILDDVMIEVSDAIEWMIEVICREEDTTYTINSQMVVMTEDDNNPNPLTMAAVNLEEPSSRGTTGGDVEVSPQDRQSVQHNCTQCTVVSEEKEKEVKLCCLTTTLMTQDSLEAKTLHDDNNNTISYPLEEPSNKALLSTVQHETLHFPPEDDIVSAAATVEIENHLIDGDESHMLERNGKEESEEEQYDEIWLARKKELEKKAEQRAKITFQSWQRDHRNLEDIIDSSLKEYIELYETAHALRLQFEAEKAQFMSKLLSLVNGRSLPPGNFLLFFAFSPAVLIAYLSCTGLDNLNFQYDIPENVQNQGSEDPNSRKRSSVDAAQSALSNSMLPQAKKRFVAPKKI